MSKGIQAYEAGLKGEKLQSHLLHTYSSSELAANRRGLEAHARQSHRDGQRQQAHESREHRRWEKRQDAEHARDAKAALQSQRLFGRQGSQHRELMNYLDFTPWDVCLTNLRANGEPESYVYDRSEGLSLASTWLMWGTEVPDYLQYRISHHNLTRDEARTVSLVLAYVLLGTLPVEGAEAYITQFAEHQHRAHQLSLEVQGLAYQRILKDRRELADALRNRARHMP